LFILCDLIRFLVFVSGKKKSSGVRTVPSRVAADTVGHKVDLVVDTDKTRSSSINALSRLSVQVDKTAITTANSISVNRSGSSSNAKGVGSSSSNRVGTEPKRLLITYDNNDPEFDEDSDPDGDLEF
jgi:hypothetical protein